MKNRDKYRDLILSNPITPWEFCHKIRVPLVLEPQGLVCYDNRSLDKPNDNYILCKQCKTIFAMWLNEEERDEE